MVPLVLLVRLPITGPLVLVDSSLASLVLPPSSRLLLRRLRALAAELLAVGAVVVLRHDVAVVVVRRARSAAAAVLLVVAFAAVAAVCLRTQALEHGAFCPDLIEGLLAHVAGLLGHVRAGAHDALAADHAVGEACQAAARVARGDAELVCHAGELRRASGFDIDVDFRGFAHDVLKQRLVLQHLKACVLDVFAAPYRDEEEDRVVDRTDALREVRDGADLVAVPIDRGGVDLEVESRALAGLDASEGVGVGACNAAEGVVLCRIEAVDADAYGACAGLFELARDLVGDQRAVTAEHGAQTLGRSVRHKLEDIIAHERLAAAEDHDLEAGSRDLIDHRLALVCRQLTAVALRCVLITVLTFEVALVGCHP